MSNQGVCAKEKEIQKLRDMAIEQKANFEYIKEAIGEMKNNHLSHMQTSLDNMDKEIRNLDIFRYKVVAWAAVLGVLAGVAMQLAFKYL